VKYIVTFFLSLSLSLTLSVLKQSPAGAVSSNVVIMQLQTAGAVSGTSSEEIIVLYNSSALDVNISNWCLEYSAAANGLTFTKLGCVTPPDALTELWVSAGGYVSFATNEFKTKNPTFVPDFVFSAGLAATGGHLRIVDNSDIEIEIDRVSWGNAVTASGFVPATKHTDGKVLSRNPSALQIDTDVNTADFSSRSLLNPIVSGLYEVDIIVDVCPNIDGVQAEIPLGFMANEDGDCYLDVCLNIDDLQVDMPEGYQKILGEDDCSLIPLENSVLFITELVANAPSDDAGQEFIELYNPNNHEVNLMGYRLQIGPGYTKQFVFPESIIAPGQ
jgi:hypothetical protein